MTIPGKKGIVHSRAGKVDRTKAGRHRNCLNVKDEAFGEVKWYDFGKHIEEWSPVVEEIEELLLTINCQDKNSVKIAKEKEIQNWQDNHVYKEVPD